MRKQDFGSVASEVSLLRSTRDLFVRLLVIGQSRNISMKKLFSHPLGPLPLSIATPEEGLVKTVKATLLNALEEDREALTNIPSNVAR